MLSHLQELRQWQEQSFQNFRHIQQEQWKQLKLEGEKVNNLLEQQLCKSADVTVLSSNSAIVCDEKNTQENMDNVQIPKTENHMQTRKKGPFTFLRRGEGLKRFQPGTAKERRKPPSISTNVGNTESTNYEASELPRHLIRKLKLLPYRTENSNAKNDVLNASELSPEFEDQNHPNCGEDSILIKQKEEMEDLAEFEILEKVAQNCSFSSDSSIVSKLLQSKNTKNAENQSTANKLPNIVPCATETKKLKEKTNPFIPLDNSQPSTSGFQERVRVSEDYIDDDDDWIDASSSEDEVEAISVPSIDSLGLRAFSTDTIRPRNLPLPELVSIEDIQFDDETSWKDESDTLEDVIIITDSEDNGDAINDTNASHEEMGFETRKAISSTEMKGLVTSSERQLLQKRLKELEDEIANFRKENALLARLRNQHELMIQNVKREREMMTKEKEEYKQKCDHEFAEEKKRLRKQQQNFSRIQKHKEHPPPKEDKNALKTTVQAVQHEMHKQQTHWLAVNGKLRTRLTSVESECNRLKAECHRLEIQKKQLTASLKEKKPVKPHPSAFVGSSAKVVIPNSSSKNEKNALAVKEKQKCPPTGKQKHEKERRESSVAKTDLQSVHEEEVEKNLDNDQAGNFTVAKKSYEKGKPRVRFKLDSDIENNEETQKSADDVIHELKHSDKVEKLFGNGDREIHYASGSRKVISGDGRTVTVYFCNGDVKINLEGGTEVYYYAESGAKQTFYPDGLEITEFPNGQEERHYKDGTKHISSNDGTVRIIYQDGTEEVSSPDGTVLVLNPDGSKVLQLVGGEREIHTNDYKRREYPDGTVKILHSDGRLETRFATGRYRLKDKDGNILVDTKYLRT